ncbi:MAG: YeeE/YedE thiosulfate transporter family protein [Planctomycetota bacterium]|jgi:uncharacterized membrane protein YedE/YeeE
MSNRAPKPYWNPYFGGVVLGLVLFAAFFLSGHGLGASGGIARIVLFFEKLIAPEHVDRSATLSEWAGGERNPLDHWLIFGVLGAALGGFVSGLIGRRVRVETYKAPGISVRTRWTMALSGGLLMGFGARLARGCTSGQALSGGASLSVGSWALMFAIFIGGYMLAYPLRRFWS